MKSWSAALIATLLSTAAAQPARQNSHSEEFERALDNVMDEQLVTRANPCPADHANWEDRDAATWWKVDATQQDHARYHAYLSMSAYGDYATECAKSFPGNFTLVDQFSISGTPYNQRGYAAKIPSMNKVVLVFEGNDFDKIDWTPVSIEDLVSDCTGCTAAKTVKELYVMAKTHTGNFSAFKKALKATGLLSSVTGHGVGGAVAILAGLDLGSKGHMQYAHNQGVPRAFNYRSIYRFDRIFEGEAAQSLISKNDYAATLNPQGPFCHVGQKVHITGDVDQWFTNCYGFNENTTCLGTGASKTDHTYYFTPKGSCGSVNKGF